VNKLTNAETVIEKLSDVIALDYDAIAAYQAAIDRLEDETYRARLQHGLADERRHRAWLDMTLKQLS
jgi:bacterioferritin (cytochrome b1)